MAKRVSTRLAQKAVPAPPPPPISTTAHYDEDEDVEVYEDFDELEDDEEYDSEAEAQAEEMARMIHDQLTADIGKVYHLKDDGTADEIIPTIRHLLSLATSEPRVHALLSDTNVVDAGQQSILSLLDDYLNSGNIGVEHTLALSRALSSLVSTPLIDELDPPRPPPAVTVTGKRKRDSDQQHSPLAPPPMLASSIGMTHTLQYPSTTPFPTPLSTIESRIRAAADTVYWELKSSLSPTKSPQLSSSIKPQLGQIYHFTTTYADAADPSSSGILREISRLIKGTDILDRSQLAYPPTVEKPESSTAVFPCYRHPCSKLFDSTANLTSHTKTHTSSDSNHIPVPPPPVARPKITPTLQYQCDACKDLFSRYDEWKSHQENGGGPACTDSSYSIHTTTPIPIDTPSHSLLYSVHSYSEKGELDMNMLSRAQDAVVRLHGPLKERAERAREWKEKERQKEGEDPDVDELGTPKPPPETTARATRVDPITTNGEFITISESVSPPNIGVEDADVDGEEAAPLSLPPRFHSDEVQSSLMDTEDSDSSPSYQPPPPSLHPTITMSSNVFPPAIHTNDDDENAKIEAAMMKMIEDAQAEAEAEAEAEMMLLETDDDVDANVDVDGEDEDIDVDGLDE